MSHLFFADDIIITKRLHGRMLLDIFRLRASCEQGQINLDSEQTDTGGKVDQLEILCDSQAAIQLAHNPVFRTKHSISSRVLSKVATDANPADVLTKALAKDKHGSRSASIKLIVSRMAVTGILVL